MLRVVDATDVIWRMSHVAAREGAKKSTARWELSDQSKLQQVAARIGRRIDRALWLVRDSGFSMPNKVGGNEELACSRAAMSSVAAARCKSALDVRNCFGLFWLLGAQ